MEEEIQGLVREAAITALPWTAYTDLNIEPIQITIIQSAPKGILRENIVVADIRTTAGLEMLENQPKENCLLSVTQRFTNVQRMIILESLQMVAQSDDPIYHSELDFFDRINNTLKVTPSNIAGLRLTI